MVAMQSRNHLMDMWNFVGDRPSWCPLIELPPHGRLIDADAFEYTCKFNYCNGCEDWNGLKCKTCWVDDMLGELENAPTIIESEGEDGRT